MPASQTIDFAGEQLELRADRTLWWSRQQILFVADVHAGKTRHMMRAGLRIPTGSLQADLVRLSAAADELRPERIIVLGDLFHSDINSEWQQLVEWRTRLTCSFELVRGNHDRFMSDQVLQAGGLVVHPEGYQVNPFMLRHHPLAADVIQERQTRSVLCGHVHPIYKFRGPARDVLRLTCFVVQKQQIILPAFGSFTGGYDISKYDYTRLVGCSPDFENVLSKYKFA